MSHHKKPILVFQHIPCEGPGRLLDYAAAHGHPLRGVELMNGDPLPEDFDYPALVVLGGSMNVYEEDLYPWLRPETAYIAEAVRREMPVLGLCLGGQLLAKATGGVVTKNARKEIGNFAVTLTEAGRRDPLFAGFPAEVPVLQWHGDTFSDLGPGELLATSEWCAHQAFRVGRCAYGLQFHVEITAAMAREWFHAFNAELVEERLDPEEIMRGFLARESTYHELAERLFDNFFRLAGLAD